MKKLLILLALILTCMSVSAKKPQTIPLSQFVAKNIDGVWHGWYQDKKIKPLKGPVVIVGEEYRRHGNFKKGIFEGTHTAHDLQDRLLEIQEYRSGRLVRFSTYYQNGNLKTDAAYDNDGRKHGNHTEHYEDGSVMSSVRYVNGRIEGDYVVRHPDGSLRSVTPMKHGTADGTIREWDEQGRLTAETSVRAGEVHGERVLYIYNAPNPIKTVETYDEGVIYGERLGYYIIDGDATTPAYRYRYDGEELASAEVFDIHGLLMSMQEYVNGKPSVWTYYSQGALTGRIEYDSDMVGHAEYYHPDGKIWKKGLFIKGQMTDEIEYDRNGNIISRSE